MPKYGDNLLLLCRGLQANGAQIFWDTLYLIPVESKDVRAFSGKFSGKFYTIFNMNFVH